jgi:hypothetical protein
MDLAQTEAGLLLLGGSSPSSRSASGSGSGLLATGLIGVVGCRC